MAIAVIGCNSTTKKTDVQKDGLKGKVESVDSKTYDAVDRFGKIEKEKTNWYPEKKVYDKKGNLIEWASYYLDGSLRRKTLYKYDDKGNLIEDASYNSDGSLGSKILYKYDDKGNLIEDASYNSDGSLRRKILYKYDDKGNLIEDVSYYNSDGSLGIKILYKYDDKGNKIEEASYNSDGRLNSKWVFKYDDKGNLIEGANYSDGRLSKKILSEYTYDTHGNWIQRIKYQQKNENSIANAIEIIERVIEYY